MVFLVVIEEGRSATYSKYITAVDSGDARTSVYRNLSRVRALTGKDVFERSIERVTQADLRLALEKGEITNEEFESLYAATARGWNGEQRS
jgi:hypothetical protein